MLFDKRVNYKPFEYPETQVFVDKMNNTFWVHNELNFSSDIQDIKVSLDDKERSALKRAMLAIAQIEVNVKSFWGDLYKYIPKPEFNNVGATFAESETRHSEAYARLLEVLGYNKEFETVIEVPVIKKRIDYLTKALKIKKYSWFDKLLIQLNLKKDESKENYISSLLLFSLLIENVSLFSQFAIVLYFTRFKGLMKNVSNIIAWSSLDENVHAQGGIYIINIIRKEYPDIFTESFKQKVYDVINYSISVESEILDWIFEKGEFDKMSKKDLLNFMKVRADNALEQIGFDKFYNVTAKNMFWFDEETKANTLDDFFAKRPVDYSKHDKPITENDLF